MIEEVRLPTYETLLTDEIRWLAVDIGTVTTPAAAGTNVLNDNTKNWANGIHKNRLVKIVRGAGAGQMALVQNNTAKSLVIKQSWTMALDTTSVYVILDVDIVSEFASLKEALSRVLEVSEDSGTATGGSNTTITDTSKNWATDMWANAMVYVIHNGIKYVRLCLSNTADTLTINALPTGVSVVAGDAYAIRRPVTIADISDRVARELGVIDSIRKWGGTTLTGRDISLDLAKLDIALSALRDALRGAGTKDFTTLEADAESILAKLDVALSTRASEATLTSQLNITLSALRDALKGASAKDFSTLEADVEAILAQLDTVLSTRASEATLSTRASETTLAKLIPIAKAALFNTALPAAETNWLGSDITPTNSPSYLRISVCVSVAGVLRVARTQGATTLTENLNSGNSLTADALYTFDVPWRTGDSINIRYSVTTGTIKRLIIDEFGAAI